MKQPNAAAERIINTENIRPLDVAQLLEQRKQQEQRCRQLQQEQPLPLLCFSLDIQPCLQYSTLARFVFDCGVAQLLAQPEQPKQQQLYRDADACRLYLLYDLDEETLQERCLAVAETTPLWRLELFSRAGRPLYRAERRSCRVCGGDAVLCQRSHAHSEEELIAANQELLEHFVADWLAQQAVTAHLEQLSLSLKPGLPDSNNNGAAPQADYETLHSSAAGLKDYFYRCARWGIAGGQELSSLRELGLAAEGRSRSVDGRPLHRAVIYLFGLLLAAQGGSLTRGGDIFDLAAGLARQGELPSGTQDLIHNQKSYLPGARQEAEAGFPLVRWGCELLMTQHESALIVLLNMMSKCHDSLILEHQGMEMLQSLQQKAASILSKPVFTRKTLVQRLDKQLIEQKVRPGGAAALLSCALFLQRSAALWRKQD